MPRGPAITAVVCCATVAALLAACAGRSERSGEPPSAAASPSTPALATAAEGGERRLDTLFQYSTLEALLAAFYDGELTIRKLARHGDTALGTINGVDGELIAVDGVFYAVKSDGRAYELSPEQRTPFAVAAFFEPEERAVLPADLDLDALERHLDGMIAERNEFQAIRIDGTFRRLETRSEPKQEPPYRPLAEVMAAEQVTFELQDVEGTMIGFRLPAYASSINVAGYHFHFIDAERTAGGHVLAVETAAGSVAVDTLSRLWLELPEAASFDALDLSGDGGADTAAVERGR